jgi:hypothetical protein
MKDLPLLDYAKANELLRRASRRVLLGSGMCALFLGGLAAYFGPSLDWDPFFLGVIGGAFVASTWLSRATYRKLSQPRVSESGFEVRDRYGRTTVPWHAIHEITAGDQSLRIRAPGHPEIRIDLQPIRDVRPLWDVIAARRPDLINLSIPKDELLVRTAPVSIQWSTLPTSLRLAAVAFAVHGFLSLVSFLVSSPPQLYQHEHTFGAVLRVILIWAFALGILRRDGKRWLLGFLAFGMLAESVGRMLDLLYGSPLTGVQMLMAILLLLTIVAGFAGVCWPGRRKMSALAARRVPTAQSTLLTAVRERTGRVTGTAQPVASEDNVQTSID